MTAALAVDLAEPEVDTVITVTGSGLSLSTGYTLTVARQGGGTTSIPVTTDGSGGFTAKVVLGVPGAHTLAVMSLPSAAAQQATLTVTAVT